MIPSIFEKNNTVEWADRGWYAVTEFERTPSVNFQRTMELAKTHPDYTPLMDERNILIYRNIYRQEDLLQFQQMYKLIRNWKGAKLYIKGEQIGFDMIGSGIQCYVQNVLKPRKGFDIEDTCNMFPRSNSTLLGCIGCRRSHVSMEWYHAQPLEAPVWFAFGRLDRHNVYRINKEELEGAICGELVEFQYCPVLDCEKIRAMMQNLPNSIDPRKDREWRYNRKTRGKQIIPRFSGGAVMEPDVLPVSEEAYQEYLTRIL